MSRARSEDNPADFRHPIQSKLCLTCGYNFARLKDRSLAQWNQQNFCSLECRGATEARTSIPSERFEDNYIPEPNSGCWIWAGAEMDDGYGHIKINGELIRAHRLSYRLHKGDITGIDVLHTCDVRLCVNPDHLYAGNHQQNMDDMVRRGRSLIGERHPGAKLTPEAVLEIRSAIGTPTEIGNRYGITRQQVGHIKSRKHWSHLP